MKATADPICPIASNDIRAASNHTRNSSSNRKGTIRIVVALVKRKTEVNDRLQRSDMSQRA